MPDHEVGSTYSKNPLTLGISTLKIKSVLAHGLARDVSIWLNLANHRPSHGCPVSHRLLGPSRTSLSLVSHACVLKLLVQTNTKETLDIQIAGIGAGASSYEPNMNSQLVTQPIELDFEELVRWDLDDLSKNWAIFMGYPTQIPQTSVIGVMSSFQLQHLLSDWIPKNVCEPFRLLVYTSSLMYTLGSRESYYGHAQLEVRLLRAYTGTALLSGLEKLLRERNLAKAVPERLRAAFLVLFGTILAVSYCGPVINGDTSQVF
jgi:hypothetical protein